MPILQLNLDNRTYEDLMEELRALIPKYCPDWTDHNASDPGITLVELFAWIAETLIYRTNRIPENSRWQLLQLLIPEDGRKILSDHGAKDFDSAPDKAALLNEARIKVAENLKKPWRAVTAGDFEEIVLAKFKRPARQGGQSVGRVRCLADLDLSSSEPERARIGHVSVIVVTRPDEGKAGTRSAYLPGDELVSDVYVFLDERRLVTCVHHVAGPDFTVIAVSADVACRQGWKTTDVRENIGKRLAEFFMPLGNAADDPDGGWPFGRDVYESEVYSEIEATDGVDHVLSLSLRQMADNAWTDVERRIEVGPNSLVWFDQDESVKGISVTSRT